MQRRVTLIYSLVLSACGLLMVSSASAQSDKDEAPGPDYVRAPAGWFHKDCVLVVPDGATIVEQDNGEVTAERDGKVVKRLAKCQHPGKRIAAGRERNPSEPPSVNGWLEYAWRAAPPNMWGMNWYNGIINSWVVPDNPTNNGGLLYFFNGLQPADSSRIIQPVLQYGTSPAGGGNFWGIAVWYVIGTSVAAVSTVGQVATGDVITGRITGNNCTAAGTCSWFIKIGNNNNAVTRSITTNGGNKTYTNAFPAVAEFYSVATCKQTPFQGFITFSNTYMFTPGPAPTNQNDVTTVPAWNAIVNGPAIPSCGWNTTLFNRGATLAF